MYLIEVTRIVSESKKIELTDEDLKKADLDPGKFTRVEFRRRLRDLAVERAANLSFNNPGNPEYVADIQA